MSDNDAYIFDASESDFETAVLQNSHRLPVLVEYLGAWSGPSIVMQDTLRALATEFAGEFIFASVDIDAQPGLRKSAAIENVPTLKVYREGEVVRQEEGQMGEDALRALLAEFDVIHDSDRKRLRARELHLSGKTPAAIQLLTEAIQAAPSNLRVAMDMVQVLVDIGENEQARALFDRLPVSVREGETGRCLLGQLEAQALAARTEGSERLLQRLEVNADDQDARFDLALCLIAEHDYRAAMDRLFEILEAAPDYREGAARELLIRLGEILAPNEPELAQACRRRLGQVMH